MKQSLFAPILTYQVSFGTMHTVAYRFQECGRPGTLGSETRVAGGGPLWPTYLWMCVGPVVLSVYLCCLPLVTPAPLLLYPIILAHFVEIYKYLYLSGFRRHMELTHLFPVRRYLPPGSLSV